MKPGNVLVGAGDQAKISDFGIARMAGDPQLTSTGLLTGTPSYFSPELARGADPGPESDVWALGATLYAAVEGASPYPTQRNPIALLQTIASEPPPRPIERRDPGRADRADDGPRPAVPLGHGRRRPRPAPRGRARPRADRHGDRPARDRRRPRPHHDDLAARRRSGGRPPPERRRRKGLLPWLLVAAALLLVAGAGYALLDLNGDATAGPTQETSTPTPSETRDASPKPSPSPSPTPTPSPEQTPSRTPKPAPAPDTAEAKADFVDGYFDVMPEDTDTGWPMLAPSMQSVGKDEYEEFWGSIESVESSQTSASTGSDTVSTVITYTFDDGRVVTEQQEIDLQGSDGAYAIADDRVISLPDAVGHVVRRSARHDARASGRPVSPGTTGSAGRGHGQVAVAHHDRDVPRLVGPAHLGPGVLEQVERLRRGVAVLVVLPHRDQREPRTETGEQRRVLVATAVVRHLEHVDPQVRRRPVEQPPGPPARGRR